jgi:putative transposase
LLASAGEVRERRAQLVHSEYKKPELLATAPNQVWSWDITKLLGPAKWTNFYLYVVLDIFSRYVVGWLVAEKENAAHARRPIAQSCKKHGVVPGTLTLHQDRGAPMRAKTFAQTLADLGVTKNHSRPHVSDDNPFSEAQFKTLNTVPTSPRTASAASLMRSRGAARSSTGTTTSIGTKRSACSRPPTCTSAARPKSSLRASVCSTLPSALTPNASCCGRPSSTSHPRRSGSTSRVITNRPQRRWSPPTRRYSKCAARLSQTC